MVGGMPLAFTQEDFLVQICLLKIILVLLVGLYATISIFDGGFIVAEIEVSCFHLKNLKGVCKNDQLQFEFSMFSQFSLLSSV